MMTTHEALVALLESLGYQLVDVSGVTADPTHIWVTHISRTADGAILSSVGEPIEHTTRHRWSRDSTGDGS